MRGRNAWLGGEDQAAGSRQRETRWLTPKYIVNALGTFDLDPCGAPDHELAKRTYLLERDEDGLALPWTGRVYLNPPYGPAQAPFMRKMVKHGHGTALTFARTETALFHETVWDAATAVLFLKGRLTFLTGDGEKAKANAGAPSCLVAYGEDDARRLRNSGLEGKFMNLAEGTNLALLAAGWDAAVRSMTYEDGSAVEVVKASNPYRDAMRSLGSS